MANSEILKLNKCWYRNYQRYVYAQDIDPEGEKELSISSWAGGNSNWIYFHSAGRNLYKSICSLFDKPIWLGLDMLLEFIKVM